MQQYPKINKNKKPKKENYHYNFIAIEDDSSKSTCFSSKNVIQPQKSFKQSRQIDSKLFSNLSQSTENLRKQKFTELKKRKKNNINCNRDGLNKRTKITYTDQKKITVGYKKYYKEDGISYETFPLYREKEIKINIYDKKVKIESAEEDYDSDDAVLENGRKKVFEDLIEAFQIIKKQGKNAFVNCNKYKHFFNTKKYPKFDYLEGLPLQ